MNLRRRRRARNLALNAFFLAGLVWGFSAFFWTSWASKAHAWNTNAIHRHQIELGNGSLYATNRGYMNGGWVFYFAAEPYAELLPPAGFSFVELTSNPVGTSGTRVSVCLPLWIPLALTLPPLLITHARVRRPLTRLRRRLCHRCAYNLASTPPDHPCPECGSERLPLPSRPGRPARPPT